MSGTEHEPDMRIAILASRQHGVVTRSQLFAAGLTRKMVDRRVESGQLRLLHRGVYLEGSLIGPLIPPHAGVIAAVLICGPGAVASHWNAGSVWRLALSQSPRGPAPVHVTTATADRGRRPGIRVHRVRVLASEDVATVDGIPVTAPARTLVDLAPLVRPRVFERALADAERRHLADRDAVAAALDRAPHSRGATGLRRLLESKESTAWTRSEAEERFLALARKVDLPVPETNVRVGEYEVDFLWRNERLIVEVDGFACHSSRASFERDRERDSRLSALGYRVVRVTWRQLADDPQRVLVRLARLIGVTA